MTFHGKPHADHHTMEHVHESPWVMLVPLFVLAIGATFGGIVFYDYFVGHHMAAFWGGSLKVLEGHDTIEAAHESPLWVELAPLAMGLVGIALAYLFYSLRPELPATMVRNFGAIYRFLYNKWYFDELYDFLFVRPAHYLAYGLWKQGDGALIDGLGPDGVSAVTRNLARRAGRLQSGYVYHYAFVMLIGVVLFITWYLFVQAR
jgi:NADH-quinone oxidoreductase subunit L